MTPRLFALACWLLVPWVARAHFVWMIPAGDNEAKVVFSDSLAPDDPQLLDKIAHLKVFGHDSKGAHFDLRMERAADGFIVKIPEGVQIVCGTCTYGVFQREGQNPVLLKYNVLLWRGPGEMPCWDCMKLQIRRNKNGSFEVLREAQPLAEANVIVIGPAGFNRQTLKTDSGGKFLFNPSMKGVYGLRVLHTTKQAGEHQGRKYSEIREYTTFVFSAE